LNYTHLPGEPIKISGHVLGGADGTVPLAGAKIEIWQADSRGSYHPEGSGEAAKYRDRDMALRGYVVADGAGAYEFKSIYPGHYSGRTRHIHVRASAAGHRQLTTQMIVPPKPGDETTPETDFIARWLRPADFVTFADENGVRTARFDFVLTPE